MSRYARCLYYLCPTLNIGLKPLPQLMFVNVEREPTACWMSAVRHAEDDMQLPIDSRCFELDVFCALVSIDDSRYWISVADVDHLKKINDPEDHGRRGHVYDPIGTRIVRSFDDVVSKATSDDPLSYWTRYPGRDSWVVLSHDQQTAEKIRVGCAALDFDGMRATVSVGLTDARGTKGISIAGAACQEAKRRGRDRTVYARTA